MGNGNKDNGEGKSSTVVKQSESKKHLKRKITKIRDKNAPVYPKNGYLLYMGDRRGEIVRQRPNANVHEINRQIAQEWNSLDTQTKEKYLKQAAVEKKKYDAAFQEYKKTESYKAFRKAFQDAKKSRRDEETAEDALSYNLKPGDVPIFTTEFLEHCRGRDSELRKLRSSVVQLEEEEEALEQRISRLRTAIRETETDSESQKETNAKIRTRLESVQKSMVETFSKFPLPNARKGPNMENMDVYVETIQKMLLSAPDEHQHFLAQVRSAASKLKIH